MGALTLLGWGQVEMPDGMSPTDPPTRLDKYFDEMKAMFREINAKCERLRDAVNDIERGKASIDTIRTIQDELREYIETRNQRQTTDLEKNVQNQIAAARSDAAREVATQMRDMLRMWEENSFKPLIEEALRKIEEKRAERRKAFVRFVLTVFGTSITISIAILGVVVFFVTGEKM